MCIHFLVVILVSVHAKQLGTVWHAHLPRLLQGNEYICEVKHTYNFINEINGRVIVWDD